MSTLRRLALITTLATYLLISVGALVRASGSGLGCPDWPKCYGQWIPPTDAMDVPVEDRAEFNVVKCWTEYLNRLVGVVIGFLVLGTAVAAVRGRRRPGFLTGAGPPITRWAVLSLVAVAFQGWLGGQVVAEELAAWLVTVHFLVAVLIVWMLCLVCVRSLAFRFPLRASLDSDALRWRRWTLVMLILATLQLLLGTVVRGEVDGQMLARPDADRASWLEQVGWIDYLHRDMAVLVLGLLVWRWWRRGGAVESRPWMTRVARFNLVVAAAQIVVGVTLAYLSLPPLAQILHVSLGTWLVGGLHLQWLLSARGELAPGAEQAAAGAAI